MTITLPPSPIRVASTALAEPLTLPGGRDIIVPITGTGTILNNITAVAGKRATLEFASGGVQVWNGSVGGSNLRLVGVYFSTVLGTLTLECDGTNWIEIARSPGVSANTPTTQGFGDAASVGAGLLPAHSDHGHGTPSLPYYENACPNGDFVGWQFGTSFVSPVDGTYYADRWLWNTGGSGLVTITRDTSVPAVAANAIATPYSAKIAVTTADASLAASDLYATYTTIEGYDYRALSNGFAVSWWAKAHRTGTYCVSFNNRAFNRSYIVEYTISAADIWQYFTAVVPAPPGTWSLDTQIGMYCAFTMATGTTFGSGASANTWLSAGQYATANQINGVAATSDTLSIWGLNIIRGTTPQPLQPIPFSVQLERLMRYCQVIGNGITNERLGLGVARGATTADIVIPLAVPMLGAPSATYTAAGNFGLYPNNAAAVEAVTAIATNVASPTCMNVLATVAGNLTLGQATQLYNSGGGGKITLVANPL